VKLTEAQFQTGEISRVLTEDGLAQGTFENFIGSTEQQI